MRIHGIGTFTFFSLAEETMGYNTESAEWPTAVEVPQAIKDLIDRFYNLLDDDRPGVGETLADEIFTPDGVAYFGGKPSTGSAGTYLDCTTMSWSLANLLTTESYPSLPCRCMEGYHESKAHREEGIHMEIRRQ